MSNFIIYALPRSRTAWLSNFLTYRDHRCRHEVAMTMRSVSDYYDFFSQKDTGTAETGAAQGYKLINYACPKIKTVVIRRPLEESIKSLLEIDLTGTARYDEDLLRKHLSYSDRMLDKISSVSGTLCVEFKDLKHSSVCKEIFEHCLPYEFDIKHWGSLKNKNIQVNMIDKLSYYNLNRDDITTFKKDCKLEMIRLKRIGHI